MNVGEYARWLYAESGEGNLDAKPPEIRKRWYALAQFLIADRKNLAGRLSRALDLMFEGVGRQSPDGGLGQGFADVKDIIRELDPRGPIT